MSLLAKFMDTMRLSDEDDDDYFLDDDYEEEKPAKRGFFSRNNNSYDDEEDEPEQPRPKFLNRSSSKVVPMRRGGMEVSLVKPSSMEDSKDICDYLLAGKAVVLNMEGLHTEVAQRIIDFASGATYSMNGNLQKISSCIFIATPESVELSGDFQDLLSAGAFDVTGLNVHFN
ncbi:MAG TPA: cell division protein SepF [Candidatus Lachnoclostridium pullistercoris]|uniref:Cell division protein SepF n=1 Tax=Candidatus Lachnoclostridium pullistercoris TaxID=2838632 RepID=A0A9D2T5E6_9FIRM|nr:cell division protein SepF [Candidatus Lachnoclostridium pullistercoris]